VVVGQRYFTQLSNELTNIVGGRGPALESTWKEVRNSVLQSLRANAAEVGCDAVIGTDIEVMALSGVTMFQHSVMMVATGTGVKLKPLAPAMPAVSALRPEDKKKFIALIKAAFPDEVEDKPGK
jgi:uncharacterized protein YbjQ (UPF0145 family)